MEKFYTIQLHHSGTIEEASQYVGGSIGIWDGLDPDKFSLLELEDMVEMVGIDTNNSRMFYRDPINGQLLQLRSDVDVLDMFETYKMFNLIPVYVETPKVVNKIEALNETEVMGDIETVNEVETTRFNAETDGIDAEAHGIDVCQWGIVDDIDEVSVYAPSDELCSVYSSSGEEVVTQTRTHYVEQRDFEKEDFSFFIGMEFACAEDFRDALRHHAIKNKYDFEFKKNERKRVTVVCVNKCGWRMHASKRGKEGNFVLKKYQSAHSDTCFEAGTNRQATSRYLAKKYVHKFRIERDWKNAGFMGHINENLDIVVSRHKVGRAKKKAIEIIEGNMEDQFKNLREYGELIKSSNPGSVFKVNANLEPDHNSTRFQRCFFCLDAMVKGFKEGCRPFIGLDGAFLKTPYKGQLLSAVGRDGDNSFYPIALAVVEAENNDSWEWFMEELLDVIGDYHEITWISDRQKGLVEVFERRLPGADHRYCVRHIYDNFKKKYPGAILRTKMWKAASAFHVSDFEKEMTIINSINQEAHAWLKKIDTRLWSKHKFTQTSKCDLCSNNMCESWNGHIKTAREKPIIHMFEMIRMMLMKRYEERREYMEAQTGLLVPKVYEQFKELKKNAKSCMVQGSGLHLYEVQLEGMNDTVDLVSKRCTCKEWQITGVPCVHAMASIVKRRFNPEDYVHPYYYRETFLKAYPIIKPLSLRNLKRITGLVPLIPPHVRIPPGRPKKARKRGADEKQKPKFVFRQRAHIKCGKCGKQGHNTRTCKNNEAGPQPRPQPISKGGRPRLPRVGLHVCIGDVGDDEGVRSSHNDGGVRSIHNDGGVGSSHGARGVESQRGGVQRGATSVPSIGVATVPSSGSGAQNICRGVTTFPRGGRGANVPNIGAAMEVVYARCDPQGSAGVK